MGAISTSLLATILLADVVAGQAPARLDMELSILESAPALDGLGPNASVSYEVVSEGGIFIWAESDDFDPFLVVESADGELRLRNDDDGGGTTAWVRAPIHAGVVLKIQVACKLKSKGGHARLRIREMPESEESRQAMADAEAAYKDANDFAQSKDLRAAREVLAPAVEALLAAPGIESNADAHGTLWRLGNVLLGWGDTETEVKVCEALIRFDVDRYPPISRAKIQPLSELCGLLAELDRGEQAAAPCAQALALAERSFGARSLEAAIVRFNLGLSLLAKKDLEGARAAMESALRDFERLRGADDQTAAEVEIALGSVLNELGELDAARRLQEHALAVMSKTLDPLDRRLLGAENNLAATLSAMGDDRAAQASHQHLLATALKIYAPDDLEVLRARHNSGIDLLRLGEFENARAEFAALTAKYRELGIASGTDAQLGDVALADALTKLGRHREALEVLENRKRIRAEQGRHDAFGNWRVDSGIAQAWLGLGEFARALELSEAALVAATQALPADNPDLSEVRQLAARLNLKLGKNERAYQLTREAVLDAQGYLARCATTLSMSQAEAAQSHWSRLVSDGLALLDATAPKSQSAQADALAFELTESARGIGTALLRCSRAGSSPGIEVLRQKVREAAREVARVGAGDQAAPALESAIAAKERAERELREALASLIGPQLAGARPDAAAVARSLDADEALIAFWRSDVRAIDAPLSAAREARLCAFVLRSGRVVQKLELGPLAPITSAVAAWREAVGALDAESAARETKAGERLRQLVIDPLLPAIKDALRWRVALDDALNLVALDALPFEGGRLGDKLRIVSSPTSTKLPAANASELKAAQFVVLGGIDYDYQPEGTRATLLTRADSNSWLVKAIRNGDSQNGFSALWETQDEIDALAALYRKTRGADGVVTQLNDRAASKGALMAAAAKANYLHIATHGFFALKQQGAANASELALAQRSPLALCGLALSGANAGPDEHGFEGVITAEEIATLDLSQCRLVVLSACDSNAGMLSSGQGLASFQKALHAAGARVVVTSLWKVSDQTTRELMLAFYQGMWGEKLAPEDALWRAKSQRIARRAPARDWAGWVLSRQ